MKAQDVPGPATQSPITLVSVEDGGIKHYVPVTNRRESLLTIVWEDGTPFAAVFKHADAALFAAAPDLLAALEGVLRVADRNTVEFDAARAAIAKARRVPE